MGGLLIVATPVARSACYGPGLAGCKRGGRIA
jgi:hypothetical protein